MVCGLLVGAMLGGTVVKTNDWNFVQVKGDSFDRLVDGASQTWVLQVDAARPFTEVVPSWTAEAPAGSELQVFLRPNIPGASDYCLGKWKLTGERTSVNEQKDLFAEVSTDTLILKQPATSLTVTVRPAAGPNGEMPKLTSFSLILTSPDLGQRQSLPARAWGTTLNVPQRAQMSYPNGGVLCSPTSVSMILSYWSSVLGKPQLDQDVPVVQAGVFDPGWPGTGNWPFNVAYAGSQPGMTGFVTRMASISDLEAWLALKVPIATSVRYGLLKGKPQPDTNDGHLVVLVGFTEQGDPIFNDPGRNAVRMTYKRADFDRAWARSGRTTYVILPDNWPTPAMSGAWPQTSNQP